MKAKKIVWSRLGLSFLLSVIWLCGKSFAIDDTLSHICNTPKEMVYSIAFVLLCTGFAYFGATLWEEILQRGATLSASCRKSIFKVQLMILAGVWIIYLMACYPGFMVVDSWWELNEYWGYEPFTTHHPPVHVLLIGVCSKLGVWLGNGNLGVFLMVLLQMGFAYGVAAYSLYTMRKINTPKWLYILYYISLLISPYYLAYFTIVIKDVPYACAFLLYMIELIYMFMDQETFWKSRQHVILWFLGNAGVYLLRNNGKYVLIPMALYLCVSQLRRKKNVIRVIVMLLLPIVISCGIQSFVNAHYDLEKGSIREALSLPFQQTARYVRDFPEQVTKEEREAIDQVLYYDLIGYLYTPESADRVKAMFKEEATGSDLAAYFKVWLQMFFKHPEVYIKATLNQNYYLVDPLVTDPAYYNCFMLGGDYEAVEKQIGVYITNPVPFLRELTEAWKQLAFKLPVVRMLYNYGFYNVILLFSLLEAFRRKRKQFIIISIPLLLSNLIVIAAPLIYMSPRYAFPIIYSMPIVIAYYIHTITSSNN